MLCATLVAFLSFSVAAAFADAGNPILNTIKYTAVDNNDGTVTISVRGQWNWLSHGSDCNTDRAATGVGIIWSDLNGPGTTRGNNEIQTVTISGATGGTFKLKFGGDTTNSIAFNASAATVQGELEALGSIGAGNVAVSGPAGGPYTVAFQAGLGKTDVDQMTGTDSLSPGSASISIATPTPGSDAVYNGYLVSNGSISAYVGTATQTVAGAVTNPVDRMVHPVDRGNVPEGYTVAGTDYPSGQQIVDPTPPNPASFASWKGGCGRLPLTATAGKGAHPEKSGKTCADGTTTCSGNPWGSWGYEKTYSHTYLKQLPNNGGSGLPDRICANFYDVHGGGDVGKSGFQSVNDAGEITVDQANDNSIDKNAFNVNDGANCITVTLGSIQLKKQFVGGPSNQRASLFIKEGATVRASASDVGPTTGQTNAISVLPGSFDISETAGSNTDLNNYTRTYACTKNGLPFVADTSLGSSASVAVGANDVVVCTITNTFVKKDPTVATTIHDTGHAAVLTVPVGTTVHDSAVVTGVAGLPGPTGNVTFQWFTNDQCTGSPVDSSSSFTLSGGSVDGTTFTKMPITAGGYAFRAVYDGDVVYNAKTGPCEPLAVTKIDPVVATTIHDGSHSAVLSVATGTTVHDSATVSGSVGTPTGDVNFQWFTNAQCSGSPVDASSAFTLPGGSVDGTTFTKTPATAGGYAFRAVYGGNGTYNDKIGPCEPLQVIGATTTKDAVPTEVNEPGATATFNVSVKNDAAIPVTLKTLVDDVYGDLNGKGSCATGGTIAAGGTYTCSFTGPVAGNAGSTHKDTVTATVQDANGTTASDDDDAVVTIKNVAPAIDVQKTVKSTGSFAESATLPETGGQFTFKLVVTNTSAASTDPLTITALSDDKYGDVTAVGGRIVSTTCAALIGQTLAQSASASCEFVGTFTGNAGASETDTVTATGKDDENSPVSDTDTASVSITDLPSSIDVTKTADPTAVLEPGAPVTYSVVVKNTSAADNVTLTSTSFTDKVGAGAVLPVSVDCNGVVSGSGLPLTLAPNESVTCTFVKTVSGTFGDPPVVDVVEVTGTDDDGNPVKDHDDAQVEILDVPSHITLVKDFVAAPAGATTTLVIMKGNTADKSQSVTDGGSIGGAYQPGTFTVTELKDAAGDVDLSLYDKSVLCTKPGQGGPVEVASSSSTPTVSFSLENGDDVTCTITNKLRPKLTVTKVVVGDTASSFDLSVGATKVIDDGKNGATDMRTYSPSTYSVTETLGDGAAVDTSVWDVVYSGDCDQNGSVQLAYGDVKSCTITNSKRPKVTVTKVVVGDTASSFDLSVGATKVIDDGKNGATDTRTYSPSTYSVTETLGDGAAVDTSVWDVVYSGDCDQNGSVQLAYGDVKSCTITNSKRPQVKVVKTVVPANDGGTFDLGINGTSYDNGGAGFGNGQGTAFVPVAKGDVTVSENDHGSTFVSSYFNDVSCDSAKGGATGAPHANRTYTFAADYGDVVTCIFTNTRKPSSIDVTKTPAPSSVNEPGGSVTYTVTVLNTSEVDKVHLSAASFVDKVAKNAPADSGSVVAISPDCNGATAGDGFPVVLDPAGGLHDSVTCTFTLAVTGNGGDKVNDRITVTGKDDANRDVSDYEEATVDVKNVEPAIDVQKTVKSTGSFGETASLPEPGGTFTYQVVVTNTSSASSDPLTLTELKDDVYGDLNGEGSCSVPQTIAVGGTYTCQFTGTFTGNPGASETDTVTATGHDDESTSVSDTDTAKVEITDVPSSIEVTKTPSPTSVPEPGAPVKFTVSVKNTSATDSVTLDAAGFLDQVGNGQPAAIADIDCNGATAGGGLPLTLAPNETATCTFTKTVTGQPGDVVHDEVTVTGTDDDGGHPSDKGDADVPVTDVPTKLAVVKTADPTSVQEGTRPITFTVTITNVLTFTADGKQWTAVDDITVFSLQDDKLGDLDAAGDVTCKVGGVTKAWPITIAPGQSIVCTVTRNITGSPSNPHVNTVTATGYDSDHPNGCEESQSEPFCKTASGSATVTFTSSPPPPPSPKSDVTVTKTATPAVTLPLGGGSAPITYTIAAKNNGPDAAQNVHVSDAAPVDVTFVSATIGKGSCTTTPQALDCTISSLAPGESVPITINATVSAAGTKTNVVVISNTSPPDTNPGNNTASASTIVTAPATPPTPKPQPKPTPEICETLIATPTTLKGNGKSQKVKVTVKKGSNGVAGAKVKITGPGISKTVRTGKNGVVIATVKPTKPGIIRVSIVGAKACNTQRIGAVGVYEPPVTG